MSERSGKSGGGLAVVLAALVVLGLPVFYALSIGPVVWLVNRGWVPGGAKAAIEFVYMPLDWLARSSDWFHGVAEWYISFWV